MPACFADPWLKLLAPWLLASGVVGFLAVWIDKARAADRQWRIPENTFFILAFLGGFWGILVGEPVFHHKTLKIRFTLTILSATVVLLPILGGIGVFDCLLSSV